jgi:hypothetical protein
MFFLLWSNVWVPDRWKVLTACVRAKVLTFNSSSECEQRWKVIVTLWLMCKFWGFTTVMFQVEVFWAVTPCSALIGYQRFRCPCCHHFQTSPWRWRQHEQHSRPRLKTNILLTQSTLPCYHFISLFVPVHADPNSLTDFSIEMISHFAEYLIEFRPVWNFREVPSHAIRCSVVFAYNLFNPVMLQNDRFFQQICLPSPVQTLKTCSPLLMKVRKFELIKALNNVK